jgi:hypothetical protein
MAKDKDKGQAAWADLVKELRRVEFDSTDWCYLAASTERLRRELEQPRPPHPSSNPRIAQLLRDLSQTLARVLRPSATEVQILAACDHAERLRTWLLDILV